MRVISWVNRFAVFGCVVKFDFAARTLLNGINDACIEGPGVNMHADGSLVEFARIQHTMHGLERINRTGTRDIHLERVGRLDCALAAGDVLIYHVKILHEQAANRDGHPAVLVAVIVHGAYLADLPADGDQLVERSLVDEVARVVLTIPGEIRRESLGIERVVLQELAKLFRLLEGWLGKFAELCNEILDRNGFYCGAHGVLPQKYNAGMGHAASRLEVLSSDHSMNIQSP